MAKLLTVVSPAWAGVGGCIVDGECDDGDPCNGLETCVASNCVAGVGTAAVCGDGIYCPADEECEDGLAQDGDGCSSSCQLEPGFTCTTDGLTTCVASCGTDFGFDSGAMGWTLDTGEEDFAPIPADAGGGASLQADFRPALAVGETAVARTRVAIPAVSDAPQPELAIHYRLEGNGVDDCMAVFLNGDGSTTTGEIFATCTPTASSVMEKDADGFDVARLDLLASAGIRRYVVIALFSPQTPGGPEAPGGDGVLRVARVSVAGDVDRDDSFEFASQASCDRCVDLDGDGYGRVTSDDPTTCAAGPDIDCKDDQIAVFPGADEVCAGGVDDDCDGFTDLADPNCDEDCADGLDNGGNGAADCADAGCAADPFCDPCSMDWSFETGPGTWDSDAQGLWIYDAASGSWQTNGPANVDQGPNPNNGGAPGGIYFGRLEATIAVPSVVDGGPSPALQVSFIHEGDATPSGDKFAVCINAPTCRFNTPGIFLLAATPTGAEVSAQVDLTPYIGQTIQVSLLYDTFDKFQNDNPGVTVTRVVVASDMDGDGLDEGSHPSCDPCWDGDRDGYGGPGSPDLLACDEVGLDCEDGPGGFAVNPGAVETLAADVCGDELDNDCDGNTDGADDGCGDEDCANGVDDNGDARTDCADVECVADPWCQPCSKGLSFDTGPGGVVVTSSGTTSGQLFQHGTSVGFGATGFETVLDGDVDSAGSGRLIGWLARDIAVPADMLAPHLELTYALSGEAATDKDVLGVCFGVDPASCDASTTLAHAFATGTNTAGLVTATIPVPPGAKGTTLSVVVFYDTVDGGANANPGAFVDSLLLVSDVDEDGQGERANALCDHCIDMDGDGWGDATRPAPFGDTATCAGGKTAPDCDDDDGATHPGQAEICTDQNAGKDNDCNGLSDVQEPGCAQCGDGTIGFGESCDDGGQDPGDGCSATCQAELGAVQITEIHIAKPNASPGEQWIELFNASDSPVDVVDLGLSVTNLVGASQSFVPGGGCTVVTGATIPPDGYYVITFGALDGTDGVGADATCTSAFQISPGGDRLSITESLDGGGVGLLDVVDFSNGFGCELSRMSTADGLGRSLVLVSPPSATEPASKSVPSAWCLAGPAAAYGNSGKNRGTPHAFGGCAEFDCDLSDDDCDGSTDEELLNTDGDGRCDAVDCAPADPLCAADCSDGDGDTVPDCADGCLDADGDGYGDPSPGVPPELVTCIAADCNDGAGEVNPAGVEDPSTGESCADDLDNDCDGHTDCGDSACFDDPGCAAEVCESAAELACGDAVVVEPVDDDFPCTGAAIEFGADAALSFTAPATETVTVRLSNDGLNLYKVFVLAGACEDGACASPVTSFATGCSTGGSGTLSVQQGETYHVIVDQIGSCSEGTGPGATVRLGCGEVCEGGVDDDLDGKTDCADSDCVLSPLCADSDFDDDGVSNAIELTCSFSPFNPLETPPPDDAQNTDLDGLLNCVDPDDDGDGTPDVVEIAQCALNPSAKNDELIHPGAERICGVLGVDADCNGTFDIFEAVCGGKEFVCNDLLDNDEDGDFDCADPDCVVSKACATQDFDSDSIPNGFEIACGSDALDPGSVPPGVQAQDLDGDDQPNCVDLDDDGDGYADVQELICGSNPLSSASVPTDTDGDSQCDAADKDDDADGYDDLLESACGSDPLDALSTPLDAAHDLDGDGLCNAQDPDADGDGWSNTLEQTCGTKPFDVASNPPSAGLDGDNDGLCDAVDADDDGDFWSDDRELLCATDPHDPSSVPLDADGNGQCDVLDQDQDDDGWPNGIENLCGTDPLDPSSNPAALGQDADGDKVCDVLDSDDDDDGWNDALEDQCKTDPLDATDVPVDTDGDGQCNFVDADDDADGWLDSVEALCGTDPLDALSTPEDIDGDGLCDAIDADADPDGDGWTTAEETFCKTDPKDPASVPLDTDSDGLCDNQDSDLDGDGWSNAVEVGCGTNPGDGASVPTDTDHDSLCNALDPDDDGDGSPDKAEVLCGTDPLDPQFRPLEIDLFDTDGDGLENCVDDDDDADDLSDAIEAQLGTNPLLKDSDADGLADGVEDADHDGVVGEGETSPTKADTDGDGLGDGVEVASCYLTGGAGGCAPSSPLVADSDDDGLPDGAEDVDRDGAVGAFETSPMNPNSDGDTDEAGEPALDGYERGCATDPLDPASFPVDKDGNGLCDGKQLDTDGDQVADGVESFCGFDPLSNTSTPALGDLQDQDGDGILSCLDPDDDNDGVPDEAELACGTDPRDKGSEPAPEQILDFDGDLILNCVDDDDDDDGIGDCEEGGALEDCCALARCCPTSKTPGGSCCDAPSAESDVCAAAALGTNAKDADSDEDGLSDAQEVTLGTNPRSSDTDGDGVQDGTEFGVVTGGPMTDATIFQPDLDPSTTTDPKRADSDNDGVCDGPSAVAGVCETQPGEDENANGRIDEGEGDPNDPTDGLSDTDGDGLKDRDELLKYGTDFKNPDTDGDGLSDLLEVEGTQGWEPTDPLNIDSDGGGVEDGYEVDRGTDPNDPADDFTGAVLEGQNFTGCASGEGGGLALLIGLALLLGLALRRRGAALLAVGLLCGGVAAGPAARAQSSAPAVGNANIENFFPAGGQFRVWSVEQSLVAPAWSVYASLLYTLENDSLRLSVGGHREKLVDTAQFLNLDVGVGLFGHAQLEIHVPFAVVMESGGDNTSIKPVSGAGLGDMIVRARGRILNNRLGGFGLGVSAGATIPVGDGDQFRGDPGVGVLAGVVADLRTTRTVLSLNLGTRLRTKKATFLETEFGHEFTYGLGLDIFVAPELITLSTEIFGRTPFAEFFKSDRSTTLELLFGPKWSIIPGLSLQAAAGPGLVKGIGTPTFRFVAGLQWAPGAKDEDGDGIPDGEDKCPFAMEDRDGFADNDGCPDDDNDKDGIPDVRDRCPNKPEDFNEFQDADGCPDDVVIEDRDSDGIPDRVDRCPLFAENYNGFQDGDGCPDTPPDAEQAAPTTGGGPPPRPRDCDAQITDVVLFGKGEATLDAEDTAALDKVAAKLLSTSFIETVQVNGHASGEGGAVPSLVLSRERAKAVVDYLADRGIERSMMVARGFGEEEPRMEGESAEARQANRRVEFSLVLGSRCKAAP
ncbi:MAG: OmpA family protein [Deltaproteobacteria bacterium]|nr:OmpA family protein [Deltaproteobacteria bacterium]